MLTTQSLRDVMAAFASADPAPGGGAAAALGSALGTSLLLMVTALPKTRAGSDEDRSALMAAAAALTGIQQQLTEAIDADTAAYQQVVAAYRQPKETEMERAARLLVSQRALRAATDVPLGVMRLSADALRHARAVAAHGHRAAASDVGVAVALLQAGIEGARLNVDANVAAIADQEYGGAVRAESQRLAQQVAALVGEVSALLR